MNSNKAERGPKTGKHRGTDGPTRREFLRRAARVVLQGGLLIGGIEAATEQVYGGNCTKCDTTSNNCPTQNDTCASGTNICGANTCEYTNQCHTTNECEASNKCGLIGQHAGYDNCADTCTAPNTNTQNKVCFTANGCYGVFLEGSDSCVSLNECDGTNECGNQTDNCGSSNNCNSNYCDGHDSSSGSIDCYTNTCTQDDSCVNTNTCETYNKCDASANSCQANNNCFGTNVCYTIG